MKSKRSKIIAVCLIGLLLLVMFIGALVAKFENKEPKEGKKKIQVSSKTLDIVERSVTRLGIALLILLIVYVQKDGGTYGIQNCS